MLVDPRWIPPSLRRPTEPPKAHAGAVTLLPPSALEKLREYSDDQPRDDHGRWTNGGGGGGDVTSQRAALNARWESLDRQLLPYVGNPTAPEAQAIVNEQKQITDQLTSLTPDTHTLSSGAAHDVVVVGSGPAGLSAAVYGPSEGLNTVLLEEGSNPGGQADLSSRVENVLGFPVGVSGDQYASAGLDQAQRMGADVRFDSQVTGLAYDESTGIKTLTLADGSTMTANTVVIAGGLQPRELGVPGEGSAGVSYNDSAALKAASGGGNAVLVGSANSAGQAAIDTASKADNVTLLTRSGNIDSMSSYLQKQVEGAPNISYQQGNVSVVNHDSTGRLTSVTLKEGPTLPADGLGIFIGSAPQTDWASGLDRTGSGQIVTNANLETSMKGVYAAGDVRTGSIGRIATSVGDGAMAIYQAGQYLSAGK